MASSYELPSPGSDDLAALTIGKTKATGNGQPPFSTGFWTLDPYLPSFYKGKGRAKSILNYTAPRSCEREAFDKYLTLDIDNSDIDIFEVHRDIIKQCGRNPKISPQSNNKIIICTESAEESEKLKNLTVIGGASVECKAHFSLNHSKGIIYAPQLMDYTVQKLQNELKGEGVVKIERMKKKVDGVMTPQPGLILTFDSCKLPEFLYAAWYRYKVKQYIPRPRRCFYCQDFGHVVTSCRRRESGKKPICVNCGEIEHGTCQKTPKCIHCGGGHSSSSNKCDVYVMEQEIQAVRIVERISFAEARAKVMGKFIRPGVSFSSIVTNRNIYKKTHSTRDSATNNSRPITNSKRARSNEHITEEPPSKLPLHGNNSSSTSSLPNLIDESRENTELVKSTSSETISVEISKHGNASASLEAASAGADAPTSLEVEPDLSGFPASSEATATASTDPGGIARGVSAVEVHAPSSPNGGSHDSISSGSPSDPAVGAIKKDSNKLKSETYEAYKQKTQPSATSQHTSKPQRILHRNPRLKGLINK